MHLHIAFLIVFYGVFIDAVGAGYKTYRFGGEFSGNIIGFYQYTIPIGLAYFIIRAVITKLSEKS